MVMIYNMCISVYRYRAGIIDDDETHITAPVTIYTLIRTVALHVIIMYEMNKYS